MITYILPCAGLGTRLGLPYPKEIHRIRPGVSLIDFSLAHAIEEPDTTEKVVLVLAPGKENVATYAEKQISERAKVERVYFNDKYTQWPGSIHSAEMHFGDFNVALLPDTVLSMNQSELLSRKFAKAFDEGADLVFAYVRETDRQRLSSLGALCIEEGRAISFCDKPLETNPSAFNAFWASFGFRRDVGPEVLDFMMKSVAREDVDIGTLGLNVKAFPVRSYVDLGTWPAIGRFLDARKLLD